MRRGNLMLLTVIFNWGEPPVAKGEQQKMQRVPLTKTINLNEESKEERYFYKLHIFRVTKKKS